MIGAAAATGVAAANRGWAQGRDADKLSRIAIMMFGLNSIVNNNMPASPTRTLDIMDIGQLCADRFTCTTSSCRVTTFPRPRCRG